MKVKAVATITITGFYDVDDKFKRLKYILDRPETFWGVLDKNNLLEELKVVLENMLTDEHRIKPSDELRLTGAFKVDGTEIYYD